MVAKKSQELKKPIRWFSVPTCYRYERPQKGRRRSFKQPNFDILGDESLYADLEIFNIIVDIFTEFGAKSEQFQIYYNSRRFMDSLCIFILQISENTVRRHISSISEKQNLSGDVKAALSIIDTKLASEVGKDE